MCKRSITACRCTRARDGGIEVAVHACMHARACIHAQSKNALSTCCWFLNLEPMHHGSDDCPTDCTCLTPLLTLLVVISVSGAEQSSTLPHGIIVE